MATQRITIAKIGGVAGDLVQQWLGEWAAARQASDPAEWSHDQWPSGVRAEADSFADRLRANSLSPPVVHFIEWSDLWSLGDLFTRWLTPPGSPPPITIYADRFEIYGYSLPDAGRLGRHLASAGPQQFPESDQFVRRLRESVEAWQSLAERAALIVLREAVGGLVTDDELTDSLSIVPEWLSKR